MLGTELDKKQCFERREMKSYAAFGKIICLELRQLKKLLAAALDKNMSASALDKKLCLEQRYIKAMLGPASAKKPAGSCVRYKYASSSV